VGHSVRSSVSIFLVGAAGTVAALPAGATAVASAQECKYAYALQKDGERELAHAAYLKVVAANPDSVCGNAGVVATRAPSAGSVWSMSGDIARDVGYVIGAIVLALLLLGIAVLLLLQVLTRTPGLRDYWPAHRIRRPVFTVEPLTDTVTDPLGAAVAGLIRGRVTWRTDRFGLNLVSGQAGVASAFSSLGDISSEASAAVAVIEFLTALLPRRRFQLSGQLQPAGEEGVGISLELSQNGNAEALTSLWAASFQLTHAPNPEAYQHLAVACAAWVDIWMTKAVDGSGLLTSDPQSWAFFRAGVDAQRLGDRERAQVLYEQALAADGTNVGALANLGILYRRAGKYPDAMEYLDRALEPTKSEGRAPDLKPDENPDWYRIKYQIAALYTNWALKGDESNQKNRADRAEKEAKGLAIKTLDKLIDLANKGRKQGQAPKPYLQSTLRPFLKGTIEPSALTLLAGTVSPLPERPEDWPIKPPTREEVRAMLAANQSDPSNNIDPWQLIAYVEQGSACPPETQFNLACFYTRAGDLTKAAKSLIRAVRETERQERQRLVDVAVGNGVLKGDPVLEPLVEKRPGIKAKLYEMVDTKAPFPNPEALTRHFDRQDRTISHVGAKGYTVNWDDSDDNNLAASKGSQLWLITLPDSEPSPDGVASASGVVRAFVEDHPDVAQDQQLKRVKASMVLPAITNSPADALIARDRGFEVLIDTGDKLENLDGS